MSVFCKIATENRVIFLACTYTPETLVSGNGSAFTSAEFALFCKHYGIHHVRSPPFHPQSNGQVERFVDTFKTALQKLKGEGTSSEIIETLLSYRATPNPNVPNNNSPAEVLFGRNIRLPVDVVRPSPPHLRKKNTQMDRQFNRHHGAVHIRD
ncbi:hypothetical protein CLF_102775 [Clonorchis sinensis]|uniref:Integrase catalytic domain-containing protein n=1 Tax=Clonorchis sinensis TaxID=79923 RepID=G7Y8H7_CLOSI|nr:hypothetical protein CLF_102775 [Clonorchis sinensis]